MYRYIYILNLNLQSNFDHILLTVGDMTEVGESVTRIDMLIRQTKKLQELCTAKVERAEEVIATGMNSVLIIV